LLFPGQGVFLRRGNPAIMRQTSLPHDPDDTMQREKLKLEPVPERGDGAYLLDAQAGFLMRVAMQRHTSIFTARMVEGLTQTQFAALAKLYEVGPCSQNHLGRLIYLDAATIKGVVDRLGLRGFLTALTDPKDRRRRAVALTPRGREVTEQAMKIAGEITAATLAPLTAEEQQVVVRLLKKLG
jgi:DNA-binding MarR family transcriptional regulator